MLQSLQCDGQVRLCQDAGHEDLVPLLRDGRVTVSDVPLPLRAVLGGVDEGV